MQVVAQYVNTTKAMQCNGANDFLSAPQRGRNRLLGLVCYIPHYRSEIIGVGWGPVTVRAAADLIQTASAAENDPKLLAA